MAMADKTPVVANMARRMGITTTTLYPYLNGDGSPKALLNFSEQYGYGNIL
jgi:hypothetical protein